MTIRIAVVIDVEGGHVGLETAKNEADALALAIQRQSTPLTATVSQVLVQAHDDTVTQWPEPQVVTDEPEIDVEVTPEPDSTTQVSDEGLVVTSSDGGVVPGSVTGEPVTLEAQNLEQPAPETPGDPSVPAPAAADAPALPPV